MHELSIAQSILEIVKQSVTEKQQPDVKWVRIRVGQLSGVLPDSLDFCFSAIVSETSMSHAALAIEQVPTVSRCRKCGHRFQVEDMAFFCPMCQGTDLELISGKELEILEIELDDKENKKDNGL